MHVTRSPIDKPWDRRVDTPTIRAWRQDDEVQALTGLIRAAYAVHLGSGLRFWGAHQTDGDTAKRLAQGHGLVIVDRDRYLGTITVRKPQPESEVELYRAKDVWSISQFAVAPDKKGCGLGTALHDAALGYAKAQGARRMALDTAAPALALLKMYQSWDYQVVGECDWRPHTNYLSLVLARTL